MYDDLIEQDPKMRRMRAESEAIGEAKGEVKGQIKVLREVIPLLVANQFPSLTGLAQEKVTRITTPDTLDNLFHSILKAPDEATAREVLIHL